MARIHDSGSNYQFYDKQINPNIRRSAFDLSRIRQTTLDQGIISPVLRLQYMPNSDIDVSFSSLIRAVNVPTVPLGSRQRLFYHLYKIDYAQMWPKWGTFMSKGRNGNTVVPLPKFLFCVDKTRLDNILTDFENFTRGTTINADSTLTEKLVYAERVLFVLGFGKGSLLDFLGFPAPDKLVKNIITYLTDSSVDFPVFSQSVPAFPVFAYLSIFRSYYLNPNLLSSNDMSLWFPDNEDDWKLVDPDLPDTEKWLFDTLSAESYKRSISPSFDVTKLSRFGKLNVSLLRYRNFADDYFTSSLFYPMRGDIPELSLDGIISDLTIPSPKFKISSTGDFSNLIEQQDIKLLSPSTSAEHGDTYHSIFSSVGAITPTEVSSDGQAIVTIASQKLTDTPITFASGFTWEMIRNLSISTLIQEKMARTDGSYIEFVRTFFDQFPSKFSDNRPQYVGGDLMPIVYTEVLQNSEDGNTPLGTIGGKGISSGDGYLGKVHSDDFGLILGLVSILPDTYYSQGWHRHDMYEVQEDFPLPERSELGMQGVLNGEIFYQGDESDLGLFGYISRYDEWRYAPNEITGKVADPSSLSFFPYTQSRYFHSLPVLSSDFVSTKDNIRKDYLTVYDEVPFYAQFAHKIKVVQPLPYKAIPVGLK